VLEDMKGIKINEMPELLPNLVVLGLINCGLNVAHALNSLAVMAKLRILSLTKNIATTDDEIRSVPAQLVRLDVADVTWSIAGIEKFFRFVASRSWGAASNCLCSVPRSREIRN
jgi:hypothetical protein